MEFSTLAAKEKDPERRRDFRELAKLRDAYGRRRRHWHPIGAGAHIMMPDDSGTTPAV